MYILWVCADCVLIFHVFIDMLLCLVAMDEGTRQKILETVEGLTQLLDVMEPWTVEVYDPSGVSEFLPATDVSIERYDPSAE
jgi:hypothetical protein